MFDYSQQRQFLRVQSIFVHVCRETYTQALTDSEIRSNTTLETCHQHTYIYILLEKSYDIQNKHIKT